MDKIARLVASTLSEGCSQNKKRMDKVAKSLRGARAKTESSEYFRDLVALAADSIEAFLRGN